MHQGGGEAAVFEERTMSPSATKTQVQNQAGARRRVYGKAGEITGK